MTRAERLSRGFFVAIVAPLVSSCNGAQSAGGALPVAVPHTAALREDSVVLPEAASSDLLYITNYSTVAIYSYPQAKHVGTLKGFVSTSAECTDSDGNVYITNEKPVAIYEYQHGKTKRSKTFLVKHGGADGCAIDPTSGDLAVSGNGSTVTIFKPGGKQYRVNDPGMFYNYYCTYDTKGDLFVDGLANATGQTRLAELRRGSKTFAAISSDVPLALTNNIQWVGSYLTALYYVHGRGKKYTPFLAQLSVKQSEARKVAASPLGGAAYAILQYYVSGDTVFAPNWYYPHGHEKKNILVYKYPSGGTPISSLSKVADPRGVVLSPASSQVH